MTDGSSRWWSLSSCSHHRAYGGDMLGGQDVCFDGTDEFEVFVGEVSAEIVEDAVEGVDEASGGSDGDVHGGLAGDLLDQVGLMNFGEVFFGDGFGVLEGAQEGECFVSALGCFLNYALLGGIEHCWGLLCLDRVLVVPVCAYRPI